jgi:hypothetical protein
VQVRKKSPQRVEVVANATRILTPDICERNAFDKSLEMVDTVLLSSDGNQLRRKAGVRDTKMFADGLLSLGPQTVRGKALQHVCVAVGLDSVERIV